MRWKANPGREADSAYACRCPVPSRGKIFRGEEEEQIIPAIRGEMLVDDCQRVVLL